jgi:hypothetical protein
MASKPLIRLPTVMTIMGRSSSITNAFINSIIPVVQPTEDEVLEALSILGIAHDDLRCAYCGDRATEWDHLRPLVAKQRPTGFITEIANLVPACGKCNQSKGNKPWRKWMTSSAPQSPKTRGVADLQAKIERLRAYENWRAVEPLDFEAIVGAEVWSRHWENWRLVLEAMKESQKLATDIRETIRAYHNITRILEKHRPALAASRPASPSRLRNAPQKQTHLHSPPEHRSSPAGFREKPNSHRR